MADKKAVLIIAKEIFRDEELFDTQAELEDAGIETTVASSMNIRRKKTLDFGI